MLNDNGKKPLIVSENLVKIYKVADLEVVALQGLDLVVQASEMLGIVGNSGSGKTTFLNILGGLDRPSAGRITVDELNLLTLSDAAINRYQREKVGFVWQQTGRNLIPYLTAQENIELPMTMSWNKTPYEKREWSKELLNAIGLYDRRKHKLTELSGGEQQRVSIAVALANKPVLLLGDEPTGEVDTSTAQTIMDTFRRLQEQFSLTIIIVTHDPRIAGQVDRVVAIRDGKISTETVRQVSQIERVIKGEDAHTSDEKPTDENVEYHEYVVLDSAGRLQVPRDFLEELGIGKRALIDLVDNRIIIRPTEEDAEAGANKHLTLEEQIALLFAVEPKPQRQGWLARLRQGRNKGGKA
jgi:putative ABC transport system ATP-binding protein